MNRNSNIEQYFTNLAETLEKIEVRVGKDRTLSREEGYTIIIDKLKEIGKNNKIISIGNGGSAAIASHFVNDLCKTDHLRAQSFSDHSFITCMANDYGYEHAYEKGIEMFAQEGDILVAISSSGNSENIINAVKAAKEKNCLIIGLSGFSKENKLRNYVDIDIFVPREHYGYVELVHQIVLHMITDLIAGAL